MKNTTIFILLLLLPLHFLCAQESSTDIIKEANIIKNILQGDVFDWGGNLNLDMRFNSIQGIDRRADPFDIRLNGQVFASIYNVKTALNINIADGKIIHRIDRPNVKLPAYAFLGMSPSYKWAKVHLGYRNLSFSPYTFNGTNFYGGGLELSPGIFRLKTFYGRLQRANPLLADISSSFDPTYFRLGWGVKTGIQKKNNDEIYFNLFYAADDPLSITQPLLRPDVTPMSNLISSTTGKKHIGKNVFIDWEYAWSGVTRNVQTAIINNPETTPFYMDYGGLFTIRNSTGFHKALNTGVNLQVAGWSFDLRHERVDPGYRSLGALFFNNDFENLTTGFKKDLLKKKLNVSGRLGIQRNNLSNLENNSVRRVVGQVQANMKFSNRFSSGFQFSNFSNTNILRVNPLPIPENDSLILTQINRNFQVNSMYIQGKNQQIIWNGFISYQQFNTITNDIINENQKVDNILFNISNTYRFQTNSSISNSLNINNNINSLAGFTSSTLSHSYSRQFMKKKLKTSFNVGNTLIYTNDTFSRHLFLLAINNGYKIDKKNEIGLLLTFVRQNNRLQLSNTFSEFNCRLKFKTRI